MIFAVARRDIALPRWPSADGPVPSDGDAAVGSMPGRLGEKSRLADSTWVTGWGGHIGRVGGGMAGQGFCRGGGWRGRWSSDQPAADAGDGTAVIPVILWLSAGPSGDPVGEEPGHVSGCIRPGRNGS